MTMEKLFTISPENGPSALLEMMFEIHARQTAISLMLVELYAEQKNMPLEAAKKWAEEAFASQKEEIRSYIYEHYGDLDLPDDLKSKGIG
jgi:uncharacterized protein YdaT